ncbi:hypothetical protein [Pontibacter sp. H249]|uniref:hypothetical protein n=1 Tax=Pontibacter sp. H249 TaxID=3133420 RepID=UPI0030C5BF7F
MNPIDRIKALAKGSKLTYATLSCGEQSITIDKFVEKFKLLQAKESGKEGSQVYYFSNVNAPNLIMRISIDDGNLSLMLENISHFKMEMGSTLL